jgi:protein-L-isoaspartate(D-aspartate) O-methyltransferase
MLDSFALPHDSVSFPDFPGEVTVALENLVEGQLRPCGVRDLRLLQTMGALPRHLFVEPAEAVAAYRDGALRVAVGRYLMDAATMARLIEAAEIMPSEAVLDIAPATGYSSAVLGSLAHKVLAIEGDPELAVRFRGMIERLQMQNVLLVEDKDAQGWDMLRACRVVFFNGAVDEVPPALLAAVEEGTRLVAAVVVAGADSCDPFPLTEARLYVKKNGHVSSRLLFEAAIPRLPAFCRPASFVF